MKINNKDNSSFRDPSGFIFLPYWGNYRQVNQIYKDDYDHLSNSGFIDNLTKKGKLIFHQEVD